MTDHADFESLSAFVDGEAPEHGPHVATCASCLATVKVLRGVQASVGVAVEGAGAEQRERHLAAATGRTRLQVRPAARMHKLRWLVPVTTAALFAVVLGVASVMNHSGSSPQATTAAGSSGTSKSPSGIEGPLSADTHAAGPGVPDAGSAVTDAGNLGEIADPTTLLDRVRLSLLSTKEAGRSYPVPAPSTLSEAAGRPASRAGGGATVGVAGARPCEGQARSREPALREVVYFATATRQGEAAYVLGFSSGGAPTPVILLLLAQGDCRLLARAGS